MNMFKAIWSELCRHASWFYKITSYRMKFCIGADFWSFESVKAVYSPTIWWRTPQLFREKGIDYAKDPGATIR